MAKLIANCSYFFLATIAQPQSRPVNVFYFTLTSSSFRVRMVYSKVRCSFLFQVYIFLILVGVEWVDWRRYNGQVIQYTKLRYRQIIVYQNFNRLYESPNDSGFGRITYQIIRFSIDLITNHTKSLSQFNPNQNHKPNPGIPSKRITNHERIFLSFIYLITDS